jgi:MFS family permease
VRPHSGIRVTTLVLAGLAMTVVAWLVLRWLSSNGSPVPEPGWVGAAAMLFLGGGLLLAGWQVRKVRDGRPDQAITPLRAARTLVLGQAGALTGAVLVGWYTANALVLLPDADVDSLRNRIWLFVLHAVVALLLAVTGMVVQAWCRLRPRDDEDDDAGAVPR